MRSFEQASRVLGELEERLMEVLWDDAPLSVREVKDRLGKATANAATRATRPAYTTVMTTLDRLYKKGLLARTKHGSAFVYQPALDRAEYQRRIVQAALTPLLEQGGGAVLAAFVDVAAGADADNLSRLEQLIEARRRRR